MSSGTLRQLAQQVGGVLHGADAAFDGVSSDTRSLAPGALFVALKGARFDGSDFLGAALARAAAGALVARPVPEVALSQIVVTDTRMALGRHARAWRQRFDLPLIAVTGSNGKTTVKEMIAAILACQGPTHATRGNLNNDIGVPLTLTALSSAHRSAVIEVGTNHPGEIAYLAHLALPSIGVITNAAAAHLQGLGTVAAVAREKGALFAALPADGTAIVNGDDPHAGLWEAMAEGRRIVHFGTGRGAQFSPREIAQRLVDGRIELAFKLCSPLGELDLRLPMAGPHNALNATCAAAAAWAAGASAQDIVAGLAGVRGISGRLQVYATTGGARLIDDAYNANPASMAAAIDCLAALPAPRWLVMGDMAELGREEEALHAAVGARARAAGIARLYAVGPLSRGAVAAFGAQGRWFTDIEALIEALGRDLEPPVTVLVKASRSARLERVVTALTGAERAS